MILAADDDRLVAQRRRHDDVEGQVGERALEADPGRHVDVEDELLQACLIGFISQVVVADERRAIGVKGRPGLRAGGFALRRERGIDDLAEKRAQMLGRAGFHLARDAAEAVASAAGADPSRRSRGRKSPGHADAGRRSGALRGSRSDRSHAASTAW